MPVGEGAKRRTGLVFSAMIEGLRVERWAWQMRNDPQSGANRFSSLEMVHRTISPARAGRSERTDLSSECAELGRGAGQNTCLGQVDSSKNATAGRYGCPWRWGRALADILRCHSSHRPCLPGLRWV